MFQAVYAHLQEDKLYYHSIRYCNNTICPPKDEQGTARNMLRIMM